MGKNSGGENGIARRDRRVKSRVDRRILSVNGEEARLLRLLQDLEILSTSSMFWGFSYNRQLSFFGSFRKPMSQPSYSSSKLVLLRLCQFRFPISKECPLSADPAVTTDSLSLASPSYAIAFPILFAGFFLHSKPRNTGCSLNLTFCAHCLRTLYHPAITQIDSTFPKFNILRTLYHPAET